MPQIDINANVNVTGPGSPRGPGSSTKSKSKEDEALEKAQAQEAAARRALTQRLGRTLPDAQIQQISRDFAEMSRASQRLRRFGGDMEKWMSGFSSTFPSQRQANRHYGDVMNQLGVGAAQQQAGGVGGMIRQAVSGMIRATGMGGGVAGGIMQQGVSKAGEAEGGMASAGGMGMLAKGAGIAALAYVGIKAVQKIGAKVGAAQDEATEYHDLRESVGGAAVGFEELRGMTRKLTDGMGISSAESVKLARKFAESSQIYGKGAAEGIATSVGQGTSFSRGFGLAPEQGVDFMATMRHFQASDGEKDNRKLAWMIGEAVGKTGAFSKADDVMNAIAHFAESSTRQSLNAPNVEGYAGLMGALGGLRLPGMDAAGAAGLMGKVSGSWANGGGDAGQAMRLGWSQKYGVDAFNMPAIGDAGPWGTFNRTFGSGSALQKTANPQELARFRAISAKAQAGGVGDTSFLDLEMNAISQQYGAAALPHALMGKYQGLNYTGARALQRAHEQDGGFGKMQGNIAAALGGKSIDNISPAQMSKLAMIQMGDSKDLMNMKDQARKLTGNQALSPEETKELAAAADTPSLRKALTKIFAFRETEDEGKAARQAAVDLERKFQEWATKIIPITTAIQEGVFALVRRWGGGSPAMDEYERKRDLESKQEAIKNGKGTDADKQAQLEALKQADLDAHPADPENKKRKSRLDQSGDLFDRMIGAESGGKQLNADGTTVMGKMTKYGQAVGVSQLLESTAKETAEKNGIPWDRQALYKDRDYNAKLGRLYYEQLLKKYKGDERKTAAAYNWGMGNVDGAIKVGGDQWEQMISNKETRDYLAKTHAGDKKVPETAKPSAAGKDGKVSGAVSVVLQHPDGSSQDVDVPLTGKFQQAGSGAH